MTKDNKISVNKKKLPAIRFDDAIEDARLEMQSMLRSWPLMWRFPKMDDVGMPLCDMVDKQDRYELQIEVPGIEKNTINISASRNTIEISGERSEKTRDYVYSERSHRSFYRKIQVPEEINPSKVSAKMANGILIVEMPKKTPKPKEMIKVEIK